MILITSTGEFILYFTVIFFCLISLLKKTLLQDCFCVVLCCLISTAGLHVSVGLNCDKMEPPHEEQYNQERNLSSNMSMRDYRHLPWQSQQLVERNPNTYRSMRDYRNQWMSAPFCSVPPTYAPPASPYYASTPQPPQPP